MQKAFKASASRVVGVDRDIHLSTRGGTWGGGCAASPEILKFYY